MISEKIKANRCILCRKTLRKYNKSGLCYRCQIAERSRNYYINNKRKAYE